MKKLWMIATGVATLLGVLVAAAWAASPIKLVVNGKEITPDMPPQLMNGRVIAPVRWVAEALGASVEWDNENQQVNITQPPDVWPGKSGLTENEWILLRNQVTRFLIAFDERKREEGQQLVSSTFDSNLVGPEVVIPIGGLYPAIIDYKFSDAKLEAEGRVRIRVKVYEKGTAGLIVRNWDFLVNRQSRLIEGLFADEKQPLKSYTVFPGLTTSAVP